MTTIRERVQAETARTDAGNDGWSNNEFGQFLEWCSHTNKKIEKVNEEEYYSERVARVYSDEELERAYARWQIEKEE